LDALLLGQELGDLAGVITLGSASSPPSLAARDEMLKAAPWYVATDADPAGSVGFAHDLAEFVEAVRAIDTRGRTFSGSGRGGELVSQDAWLETCFANSERLLDVPALRRMWASLRELPRGSRPDIMSHGDLMPGNILVADGRLAGVIDVGGLGPADPALDLVGAWHLLDPVPRLAFRDRLGCDDEEWERGKGWAFAQSMGLVWYYADTNPTMAAIGRRTLDRLVASAR
jgi:aminoglycoside phosphotransferase (APT) family kinase protein